MNQIAIVKSQGELRLAHFDAACAASQRAQFLHGHLAAVVCQESHLLQLFGMVELVDVHFFGRQDALQIQRHFLGDAAVGKLLHHGLGEHLLFFRRGGDHHITHVQEHLLMGCDLLQRRHRVMDEKILALPGHLGDGTISHQGRIHQASAVECQEVARFDHRTRIQMKLLIEGIGKVHLVRRQKDFAVLKRPIVQYRNVVRVEKHIHHIRSFVGKLPIA